jgi:hypothetical protein
MNITKLTKGERAAFEGLCATMRNRGLGPMELAEGLMHLCRDDQEASLYVVHNTIRADFGKIAEMLGWSREEFMRELTRYLSKAPPGALS